MRKVSNPACHRTKKRSHSTRTQHRSYLCPPKVSREVTNQLTEKATVHTKLRPGLRYSNEKQNIQVGFYLPVRIESVPSNFRDGALLTSILYIGNDMRYFCYPHSNLCI